LIDNFWGAGAFLGGESDWRRIKYDNVHIYGESQDSKDCEVQDACLADPLTCENKAGLMLSIFTTGSNRPFPRDGSAYDEIYSDAAWGGVTEYYNVYFYDFYNSKTFCGGKQQLFDTHRNGTDYYPIQRFYSASFKNVHEDNFGFFRDPNPIWATVEKCGAFPCTGPQQIVMRFESTKWYGGFWNTYNRDQLFFITSRNDFVGPSIQCQVNSKWNGYYCN